MSTHNCISCFPHRTCLFPQPNLLSARFVEHYGHNLYDSDLSGPCPGADTIPTDRLIFLAREPDRGGEALTGERLP